MYYDSYYKSKPTSLGALLNVKLNKIFARKINNLFIQNTILKICEIGYGRGLLADAIRAEKKDTIQYFAIEPNHLLAEQGRSKGDNIRETKIPPFPKDKEWNDFNVIIFSHVIEHFHHYDTILTVLDESFERLKNDGFLIIFFPDYLDYKEDFFSIDYSHEYILTLRRMQKILSDAHFTVVEKIIFRSCFSFPFSVVVYPIHLLIKILAGALWNITGKDVFFKMKITFAKNICLIVKKNMSN